MGEGEGDNGKGEWGGGGGWVGDDDKDCSKLTPSNGVEILRSVPYTPYGHRRHGGVKKDSFTQHPREHCQQEVVE